MAMTGCSAMIRPSPPLHQPISQTARQYPQLPASGTVKMRLATVSCCNRPWPTEPSILETTTL